MHIVSFTNVYAGTGGSQTAILFPATPVARYVFITKGLAEHYTYNTETHTIVTSGTFSASIGVSTTQPSTVVYDILESHSTAEIILVNGSTTFVSGEIDSLEDSVFAQNYALAVLQKLHALMMLQMQTYTLTTSIANVATSIGSIATTIALLTSKVDKLDAKITSSNPTVVI